MQTRSVVVKTAARASARRTPGDFSSAVEIETEEARPGRSEYVLSAVAVASRGGLLSPLRAMIGGRVSMQDTRRNTDRETHGTEQELGLQQRSAVPTGDIYVLGEVEVPHATPTWEMSHPGIFAHAEF